jgi:regulator of protease activity HflC (stomatin/prohibitin superfamily)
MELPNLSPLTVAIVGLVLALFAFVLAVPVTRKSLVGFIWPRRVSAPAPKSAAPKQAVTRVVPRDHPPRGTFFVVRHGMIERTPPESGGERTSAKLTVVRDHAVTLEDSAGHYFGIAVGPAVQDLAFGVEPRLVIITRPRYKRMSVRDLPTKDGRSLERVDFGIQYQIDTDEAEDVELKVARPRTEALFRAAYRVVFWEEGADNPRPVESWEMTVQEMAKTILRQEIARRTLDNIYNPDEPASIYQAIENIVLADLQTITTDWGVQIQRIQIHGIWPAEEYRRALVQQWEAQRKGLADAERLRLLEKAKGEAWRRMVLDVQQGFAKKSPNQPLAVSLIEFMKYLDTLVEVARATDRVPSVPAPSQLDRLISENAPKPEILNELESQVVDESESDSAE